MAGFYNFGVKEIMGGNIDLVNDDIIAVLVNTELYTADLDNDRAENDIPDGAILAEVSLTAKTLDGTTYRANNLTFPAVEGDQAGAVLIVLNDELVGNCTLVAYLDNAPGFPVTPTGEDITINWDTGDDGIFKM